MDDKFLWLRLFYRYNLVIFPLRLTRQAAEGGLGTTEILDRYFGEAHDISPRGILLSYFAFAYSVLTKSIYRSLNPYPIISTAEDIIYETQEYKGYCSDIRIYDALNSITGIDILDRSSQLDDRSEVIGKIELYINDLLHNPKYFMDYPMESDLKIPTSTGAPP